MKIAVIGSGYVGLVVGTCFADTGNRVTCVDVDEDKIARLQRGEIPIFEPGLEELIQRNVAEGRLFFSTDIASAIKKSQVIFIAVGTPQDEDGGADLRHVLAVADAIGTQMEGYKTVVLKSTVPVGTNKKVRAAIAAVTRHPFDVVSNPEFLLFPMTGGAAFGHFLFGAPPDLIDHVFRRAWLTEPPPENTYELVPMEPPMTPVPAGAPLPVNEPAKDAAKEPAKDAPKDKETPKDAPKEAPPRR